MKLAKGIFLDSNDVLYIYIYERLIYVWIYLYVVSVKLTLSACVWQWSCTRYTWADNVVASGSGKA